MIACQRIKSRIEHANNLGRFIRHNACLMLVPQHWHRYPPTGLWVAICIDLMQKFFAIEMVARGMVVTIKAPALIEH